jgi:hypothetical protein
MIARVVVRRGATFDATDPVYQHTCRDVLGFDRSRTHGESEIRSHEVMNRELADVCRHVETALQESG